MAKLNRTVSFLSLFAGSILLTGVLISYSQIERVREEVARSVTVAVYLDSETDKAAGDEVDGAVRDSGILYIKNFMDSRAVYERIAENTEIADKLEIAGPDFVFPAVYEIGVKKLNIKTIDKTLDRIGKLGAVEHIEYNRAAVLKAVRFFDRFKSISDIVIIIAGIICLFLYFTGSCFRYFVEKEEYGFLKLYRADLSRRLGAGIANGIVPVFYTALIAVAALYFLLSNIPDMGFSPIKVFGGVFAGSAAINSFLYFLIVKYAVLNKDK